MNRLRFRLALGILVALAGGQAFAATCAEVWADQTGTVEPDPNTACLRWEAPTQNVDGSPLTDLGGFRIFWGPNSRNYPSNFDVPDATETEMTMTIVLQGETDQSLFFAMTAYDLNNPAAGFQELTPSGDCSLAGNENACDNESAFSNEVIKLIRYVPDPDVIPPGSPQQLEIELNIQIVTPDGELLHP